MRSLLLLQLLALALGKKVLRGAQKSLVVEAQPAAAAPAAAYPAKAAAVPVVVKKKMAPVTIRTPKTDKRTYNYTVLSGGLRVLAVQDPEAKKTAMAVTVQAGSLEDPADFEGLAHFTEHMVFLGSKKYPKKDELNKHLSAFGGRSNAYTSLDRTVYFMEVGNKGVDKAVDIFSHFFIDPKFTKRMIYKEINAVDSEHKKNMPDPKRRLLNLFHRLANEKSPIEEFATGNMETLVHGPESRNLSTQTALKKFHAKHYCERKMLVVIVSSNETSKMIDLVENDFDYLPEVNETTCKPSKDYSHIPQYNSTLKNLGMEVNMGTRGQPELWLQFPMPSLRKKYKEMAEAYIYHALSHFGPGGLKSLLKREDLSLSYQYYMETTRAGSNFYVIFSLTENGAKNMDKIMQYFFAYMKVIKNAGVDMELLKGLQNMRQVAFDYQEKEDSEMGFASELAGSLDVHKPEDVLTGGTLIDVPDKALIETILSKITPDNLNIARMSPDFKEAAGKEYEHDYEFRYNWDPIDPSLLVSLWSASEASLAPPPRLEYLPTKLDVISEGSPDGTPQPLIRRGRLELWWLGMGNIKLPKVDIRMKLSFAKQTETTAAVAILANLHSRLVRLSLEESTDKLQSCGLSYSVASDEHSMSVSFYGFDQYVEELIKLVLPKVRQPSVTQEGFSSIREKMVLDLLDVTALQPYQHAMEAFNVLTTGSTFARKDLLSAVNSTAAVSLVAHDALMDQLFQKVHLSILVTGNAGRTRSKEIAEYAEKVFNAARSEKDITYDTMPPVIDLQGDVAVSLRNPIPDDANSATVVVYQFGIPTVADRVHLSILSGFIDRPIFEVLRTEYQLGYVVSGYITLHGSVAEVRVLVQGFRESPTVVDKLIEQTVQNLTAKIANMSSQEVATRKETLKIALSKKPMTLPQMASKYWGEIFTGQYCFNRTEQELNYLNGLSFDDATPLVAAWQKAVAASNSTTLQRKKVSVKLYGTEYAKEVEHDLWWYIAHPESILDYLMGRTAPASTGDNKTALVNTAQIRKKLVGDKWWPTEPVCK